jgi:hypothetical protein
VNRSPDTLVGTAPAEDIAHCCVDIGICRIVILSEQRCGRHDMSGLTVAALGHFLFDPRSLHRMAPIS